MWTRPADAVVELAGHRLGLRDLLRLEPLALEHVHEVHVAAEVELVGLLDFDTAVFEEAGEVAVDDRGADLGLDVVADDRHTGIDKALRPLRVRGDEHGDAVDEPNSGLEGCLGVELGGLFRTDRQVGDEHVGSAVAQGGHHVDGSSADSSTVSR